jgi:hypothetical protein
MPWSTRETPYLLDYISKWPKSRDDQEDDNDVEIKVGHFVKVSNSYESFWVEVIEVGSSTLKGRIDNDIEESNDHNEYNDIIQFRWCNVLDHME